MSKRRIVMQSTASIRELTANEIEQVDGGILPLIMLGIAIGSKLTAGGLASWAFASVGLIGATYAAAEYWGG